MGLDLVNGRTDYQGRSEYFKLNSGEAIKSQTSVGLTAVTIINFGQFPF